MCVCVFVCACVCASVCVYVSVIECVCMSMGPEKTHIHTHEKGAYSMGNGDGIHPRGQTSRPKEEVYVRKGEQMSEYRWLHYKLGP